MILKHLKGITGKMVALAVAGALMTTPAFAGSVSGDPAGAGISASIPTSATVTDYAEIVFNQCAFSAMTGPGATATCTDSAQVKSNANINVTFTPTRMTRSGGTEHINSSYTFAQGANPASAAISADPGSTNTSYVVAQNAAPLDTPTTYAIAGSASVINGETIAGSYNGTIVVTVVKQ
ncbi:MAG: hypothetical protein AB1411_15810 [Nitrospirota bacterium]